MLPVTATSAQDAPPPGFAPTDTGALTARWPFTDPAFHAATTPAAVATGAEDTLKALVDAVAHGPRFAVTPPTPTIAEGATPRPPADTALWPMPADGLLAQGTAGRPAPERWTLTGDAHRRNAAALDAVIAYAETARHTADTVGIATLMLAPPEPAATTAARAFRDVLDARNRTFVSGVPNCDEEPWCVALRAARAKASASGGPAALEDSLARYLLEAGAVGLHLQSSQSQARIQLDHNQQRAEFGVHRTVVLRAIADPAAARQLPWELSAVIGASVWHLRGLDGSQPAWPVVLNEAAAKGLEEPGFGYSGFDLDGIAVTRYAAAPEGGYEVNAALTLMDGGGRRASLSLVLRFAYGPDAITVTAAELAPLAPVVPAAEIVLVPVARVSAEALRTAPGPLGLMRLVRANAVKAATASSAPQDYYVFAFVADRLPGDARLGLRIADKAAGIGGFPAGAAERDFDGWRVLAAQMTLTLNGPVEFTVKAVFAAGSGPDAGQRAPAVAATMSSYVSPQATAAAPTAADDAPGAGTAFPNLARRPQ